MERRQLEYFLAVVQHGGVNRAAAHLHVSQPTISTALRRLERELGGLLFERTQGRFILTAAGHALVEPAQQVVRDFTNAVESTREVLGLGGGHLDICAIPAVGTGWLTRVVAAFRRRYPDVGIRVHPQTDDQAIATGVRSGRYNLGLAVSATSASGLVTRQVGYQDLQAVLPPGSAKGGEPVRIEELAAMDLVTLHGDGSRSRRWFEQELAKRGLRPRVPVELGSIEGILPLVTAGAGYALWWTPMADLTIGSCVVRPIRPRCRRPIVLMLRPGSLPPATTALLETADSLPAAGPS